MMGEVRGARPAAEGIRREHLGFRLRRGRCRDSVRHSRSPSRSAHSTASSAALTVCLDAAVPAPVGPSAASRP